MYENAVPVFEMKNKLSFYMHKAQQEGPVFISNRGKAAFVLQTIEDYEEQILNKPKEKTLFEAAAELRKKYGLENDDFDFSVYYESIKENHPMTRDSEEQLFDEV